MDTLNIKILIVITLLYSFLWCDNIDLENLKLQLIEQYSKINTYQAEFEQLNYWQEMDISKRSSGYIIYDRYNLKLEYTEPSGQFLLLDSLSVTMYDPNSNQAFIIDSFEMDIRPIAIILKYWESSEISVLEADNGSIQLELNTDAEEIIQLSISDSMVNELKYFDLESNSVTYKFKNEIINKALPELIYQVELPEDVNIIDTRQ